MGLLKGIEVKLYTKTQNGSDPFGVPIYTETEVTVNNVLVTPLSETEVLDTYNLTGRRAVYQLGIPKGDTHDWVNMNVKFFNKKWHVIGDVLEGIDSLIPLEWNKKIRVEQIDGED